MRDFLQRIKQTADEAVFPSNIYCISCGSLIDGTRPYSLCDKCATERFHWINGRTCDKCGKALPDTYRGELCYDCMIQQHDFKKGYSCLTYGLHEREILMAYKYNGKGYLGRKLGDILYDRFSCENIDIDVIIPVPVSKRREKQRGYNQAELMAGRLAKLTGIPMEANSFLRVKETTLLRSMNPAERESALADAFSATPGGKRRIKGKTVLLVDDIYTTGATADACSKMLREAGAAEVYLLTLASGGNRRPKDM